MIGNEALEVVDCVAVGDLVIEVEESIPKLCVGLRWINELWECFPTFCYVSFEERGHIFLLFKAASDRTLGKESVKVYEVLSKHASSKDGNSQAGQEVHSALCPTPHFSVPLPLLAEKDSRVSEL